MQASVSRSQKEPFQPRLQHKHLAERCPTPTRQDTSPASIT